MSIKNKQLKEAEALLKGAGYAVTPPMSIKDVLLVFSLLMAERRDDFPLTDEEERAVQFITNMLKEKGA